MLNVSGIRFSYGSREILKGVSFDVQDDEIMSILGPNGAGKTTLLNCICNFNKHWEGAVQVSGHDVRGLRSRELAKHIGFVPQKTYPSKTTVFDAVLVGRRPYIEWSATAKDLEITWDVIRAMKLENLALRNTNEISGGELQKVVIARALVQEPDVIILDEPTNNLDIANQHMTMRTIFDAVREKGISTVMTMHDIGLALHYSDSLMFMRQGEVVAYGGPEIIDEGLIKEVYGMDVEVIHHNGLPAVVPRYDDDIRRHKELAKMKRANAP